MPDWLRVALAALALYRVTQLVTIDDGPWRVFFHLRAKAGAYDRDETGHVKSGLGQLLGCPYCLGMWLAVPVAALVIWPTAAGDAALVLLGIAGAQAWLQGNREAL